MALATALILTAIWVSGVTPAFGVDAKCVVSPIVKSRKLNTHLVGLDLRVGNFKLRKQPGRLAIAKIAANSGLALRNVMPTAATPHLVSSLLQISDLALLINGGYFDLFKFETKGKIVEGGRLTSWTQIRSHQLSLLTNGKLSPSDLRTSVSVSPFDKPIFSGAVNAQVLGDAFSIFTDKYPSIAAPPGALTIVASEAGIVSALHQPGVLLQPHTGQVVMQIPEHQMSSFTGLQKGSDLKLKYEATTTLGESVTESFGVGPTILRAGRLVQECNKINQEIAPRAAIGWNAKGELFLATASSGQAVSVLIGRSGGATTTQMARWLRSAGASNAVLLDGGGSVCFFVKLHSRWVRLDEPYAIDARPLPNAIGIFKTSR